MVEPLRLARDRYENMKEKPVSIHVLAVKHWSKWINRFGGNNQVLQVYKEKLRIAT